MSELYPLQEQVQAYISAETRRFRYSHDWLRIVTWSTKFAGLLFVLFGTVAGLYLFIALQTFSDQPENATRGVLFSGSLTLICLVLFFYVLKAHRLFFSRLRISDRFLIFLDQALSRNTEGMYYSAVGIVEQSRGARDLPTKKAFAIACLVLVDNFLCKLNEDVLAEVLRILSLLEGFSMDRTFVLWAKTRIYASNGRYSEAQDYLKRYLVEIGGDSSDPQFQYLHDLVVLNTSNSEANPL